jgi:hypothetical protein
MDTILNWRNDTTIYVVPVWKASTICVMAWLISYRFVFAQILDSIISGLQAPVSRHTAHELLSKLLMPLHQPDEFEEWRDQVPAIQVR